MVSDDRTVNFWHKVETLGEVSPSARGATPTVNQGCSCVSGSNRC